MHKNAKQTSEKHILIVIIIIIIIIITSYYYYHYYLFIYTEGDFIIDFVQLTEQVEKDPSGSTRCGLHEYL